MIIDENEDRRKRTEYARLTSDTLNGSAIYSIIKLFRSSARNDDLLSDSEHLRLMRCALDLEKILKWKDEE